MSGNLCQWCGASSQRECEWEEMTGNMPEGAPCQFDGTWDEDPDDARDKRDEYDRLAMDQDE